MGAPRMIARTLASRTLGFWCDAALGASVVFLMI